MGFCNLTEIIVRAEDTLETLKEKVAMATKIGTWQSTLTNFPYLREQWKKNAEEERLLGVSMTGQMSHPVLNGREGRKERQRWLKELKHVAIMTNRKEARRLGINPAAAITTGKPAGTVSSLTNTPSGIHAWHDLFYIRTVRCDKNDPLAKFMEDAGVPVEEDVMNPKALVFSFPFKAPEGAVTRNDQIAIDQLENWLDFKTYWTEHSQSVTISVKDEEWEEVGNWVYEHFDVITGISFLPYSDHVYKQAPFQTVDEETYEAAKALMPAELNWDWLPVYETEDTTTGSQTLACTAGVCDVVDLIK
jgi:ribonucleoside-diphosphate reductase alpha chain